MALYKLNYRKPDGRLWIQYSRTPLSFLPDKEQHNHNKEAEEVTFLAAREPITVMPSR